MSRGSQPRDGVESPWGRHILYFCQTVNQAGLDDRIRLDEVRARAFVVEDQSSGVAAAEPPWARSAGNLPEPLLAIRCEVLVAVAALPPLRGLLLATTDSTGYQDRRDRLTRTVTRACRPTADLRSMSTSVTPEIEWSDSTPRVRDARSVAFESAPLGVHAAMAGDRTSDYSRRDRKSTSGERFPACEAGRRLAGMAASRSVEPGPKGAYGIALVRLKADPTYERVTFE